jgi:hypothetical protein
MTPEATLLPPPPSLFDDDDDDNTSTSRTLEGLGASAVLGAIIEQRRRIRREHEPDLGPHVERSAHHARDGGDEEEEEENRVVTKSGPVRRDSEGFLKVR